MVAWGDARDAGASRLWSDVEVERWLPRPAPASRARHMRAHCLGAGVTRAQVDEGARAN